MDVALPIRGIEIRRAPGIITALSVPQTCIRSCSFLVYSLIWSGISPIKLMTALSVAFASAIPAPIPFIRPVNPRSTRLGCVIGIPMCTCLADPSRVQNSPPAPLQASEGVLSSLSQMTAAQGNGGDAVYFSESNDHYPASISRRTVRLDDRVVPFLQEREHLFAHSFQIGISFHAGSGINHWKNKQLVDLSNLSRRKQETSMKAKKLLGPIVVSVGCQPHRRLFQSSCSIHVCPVGDE